MNWRHFHAMVWLRWRVFLNRLRKGGAVNAVIQTLLTGITLVGAIGGAVVLSVVLFLVGLFALRDASPAIIMYVWDAGVAVFLFGWLLMLLIELQRSDPLSLDKFLHLPVSPTGIFLINYLSSLVNLILIVFTPAMCALAFGLAFAKGPALLLLLPLIVAFLLMVTAVTYQFQGWLATLMANKRRRRTIIVFITMGFILVFQLPNLLNMMVFSRPHEPDPSIARMVQEQSELRDALGSGKITVDEFNKRVEESQRQQKARADEAEVETLHHLEGVAWIVNLCLPPGWLALGAWASAEGNPAALLAVAGMTGLGAGSLWRAHRTTVRLFTGQFNSGKRRPVVAAAVAVPAKPAKPPAAGLLEWRLPRLSEQASAVALGGVQSLLRAPEAKMMLFGPILLVIIFGGLSLTHTFEMPAYARPLMAFGALSMIMLTMTQLVGNQFGFDRGGFRVYVLSAAPRREILLGKNMATAPLAFGLSAVVLALLQIAYPMRWDYFLAAAPQALSMYLLFCLLANCLSIYAPVAIPIGSFKQARLKGLALLLQFVFLFLFPWSLLPALVPLGVELGANQLGWNALGLPICLMLAVLECAAICYLYFIVLAWQGRALQGREQKILAIVTPKAEG